jgi:arylsulfatase A-like enzyme
MKLRLLLLSLLLALISIAQAASSRPPNIIFFLADDLGWTELNCYSNHFNSTPNLDRLASQGIRFTQAYAAAPVCSPDRAALMTGQYPARLHITDYLHPTDEKFLSPDYVTINEQLKKAGYVSGLVGKWHLNGDYGRQRGTPQQHGFDEVICTEQRDIAAGSYWHPYKFMTNVAARLPHEYLTDRLNLEALDFINRHKDNPFFLYLAHYSTHTRLNAKPGKLAKFNKKPGAGKNKNNPELAAMLESLDDGMGQIMAELDKLGLTKNTVVIFMSDNGGERTVTDNYPLRAGKSFLYEGGLRVPSIVKWPGHIKPGQISDVPIITQDFYPTLMDIAAVKPDKSQVTDGVSLIPLFKGKKHLSRENLYWHYPMEKPHFLGGTSASAIRSGDWKLIEFLDTGKVELYDLAHDLPESHDLSSDQPKRAEKLRKQLDDWKRAVKAE